MIIALISSFPAFAGQRYVKQTLHYFKDTKYIELYVCILFADRFVTCMQTVTENYQLSSF